MELNELTKTTVRSKKRIGRGCGSGKGFHTVGRGVKGQKSRVGNSIPAGFEGGQVPLYKRIPKIAHFNSRHKDTLSITLDAFNKFEVEQEVTPSALLAQRLIRYLPKNGVKVLAGTLSKKLIFKGFSYSGSARTAIEQSGSAIVE